LAHNLQRDDERISRIRDYVERAVDIALAASLALRRPREYTMRAFLARDNEASGRRPHECRRQRSAARPRPLEQPSTPTSVEDSEHRGHVPTAPWPLSVGTWRRQ
jgi:hypothetical protein